MARGVEHGRWRKRQFSKENNRRFVPNVTKSALNVLFFPQNMGSSSQGMPTPWEQFRSWLSDATAAGYIDRRPEEVLRDIETRGPRDIADAALVLKVETNEGVYNVEVPVAPHKLHALLAPIKGIDKKIEVEEILKVHPYEIQSYTCSRARGFTRTKFRRLEGTPERSIVPPSDWPSVSPKAIRHTSEQLA